jgi:nucleolar MIF4G domain-containing protein 1
MLDTIAALRTNNARKIPNYDPSLLEHMKKLLRGIVHSSGIVCVIVGGCMHANHVMVM